MAVAISFRLRRLCLSMALTLPAVGPSPYQSQYTPATIVSIYKNLTGQQLHNPFRMENQEQIFFPAYCKYNRLLGHQSGQCAEVAEALYFQSTWGKNNFHLNRQRGILGKKDLITYLDSIQDTKVKLTLLLLEECQRYTNGHKCWRIWFPVLAEKKQRRVPEHHVGGTTCVPTWKEKKSVGLFQGINMTPWRNLEEFEDHLHRSEHIHRIIEL